MLLSLKTANSPVAICGRFPISFSTQQSFDLPMRDSQKTEREQEQEQEPWSLENDRFHGGLMRGYPNLQHA